MAYITEDGQLLDAEGNAVAVDIISQDSGTDWIPGLIAIVAVIVIIVAFCIYIMRKRRKTSE